MIRMSHRLLVSDTVVAPTQQRGVDRYFQHILIALARHFENRIVVVSPRRTNVTGISRVAIPAFYGSGWLGIQDKVASVVALYEKPRLFFSPYYGNARITAPQVFTVYDLIHERFPQYFPNDNWQVKRFIAEKRNCLERAALLLAISDSTARDLIAQYPDIDPAKIVVTPLGVDASFFAEEYPVAGQSGRPYFLFVGHRALYKNFERALIAYGESGLAAAFDFRVISPAGGSFTEREQKLIDTYHLRERVRLTTAATEARLRQSYAGAVALIYPSEYEGFGLPILEAMASGTLVATSNTSSMPEVGGDVAFYFDPLCIESIARCLRQVVELSPADRHCRIAAGIARARSFTWARCQELTVAAFLACMDQNA
jgi:glycosyltransferase involved in cell wall biosynthesis